MPGIPIHLLNAFVAFNESPNISVAALQLGITQPALTKQLQALESLLPHRIFLLQGRKKILTPFGQNLHSRIKERIENLDSIVQEVSTLYSNPEAAHLRISARLGILDRISENLHFRGCLTFQEATNEQVIKDLLSQGAEIGIAHSLPDTHGLIAKPLFKEEFQILIPKILMRARKNYGRSLIEALKDLPCIDFKQDDVIIKTVFAANAVDSSSLKVSRITPNYVRIAKLVDLGLGWAIIPSYLTVNESKTWSIKVPSEVINLRKFYVAYRSEFSRVPWVKEIIQQITDAFKVKRPEIYDPEP